MPASRAATAGRASRAGPARPGVAVKRVVVIDEHELIRQGLQRIFERAPDFEVVGETAGVLDGIACVTASAPDLVVLDTRLPDGSGLDAVRELRAGRSALAIVVLTMHVGDQQMFAAMEAGASTFVAKGASADTLLAASRRAVSSPESFSAIELADAMRRRLSPTGPALSPREQQVLTLLADGLAVAAIARALFISESTTKTHIAKVYDKLGAANRAQALMAGMRAGLISALE